MKEGYKRIAWQAKTDDYHIIALRFGLPPQPTDGKCEIYYPHFSRIRHLINQLNNQ